MGNVLGNFALFLGNPQKNFLATLPALFEGLRSHLKDLVKDGPTLQPRCIIENSRSGSCNVSDPANSLIVSQINLLSHICTRRHGILYWKLPY